MTCKPCLSKSHTGKFEVFTSADHRSQELEALSQTVAHATACSAMLSAHCRCVMAVYHVEKHLACLHIGGALITFLACCSRQHAHTHTLFLCKFNICSISGLVHVKMMFDVPNIYSEGCSVFVFSVHV
jgi:hypothetical protein